MALYLVQHGRSLPEDQDPERGLAQEGISDVNRIANLARDYGIRVSCIQHSGKKRAQQTADIFASTLNPERGIQQRDGINPLDDVKTVADQIDSGADLMLVGHLPFMARLTSYLVTGQIEKPVFKFQNGGILCLDREIEDETWVIKWALLPTIE
jgi:phosphohistidine phosphatase